MITTHLRLRLVIMNVYIIVELSIIYVKTFNTMTALLIFLGMIILGGLCITFMYTFELFISPLLNQDGKFMKWWRKNVISDIDFEP